MNLIGKHEHDADYLKGWQEMSLLTTEESPMMLVKSPPPSIALCEWKWRFTVKDGRLTFIGESVDEAAQEFIDRVIAKYDETIIRLTKERDEAREVAYWGTRAV